MSALESVGALRVARASCVFRMDENLRHFDLGGLLAVVAAVADDHLARLDGALFIAPARIHAVRGSEHPLRGDERAAAATLLILKGIVEAHLIRIFTFRRGLPVHDHLGVVAGESRVLHAKRTER